MGELPDYKDNAEAYELEERSRPDEMAMLKEGGEKAKELLSRLESANVLDLCCGTGLSMEYIVNHQNTALIVGVDISKNYLEFCQNQYKNSLHPPLLIQGDAVTAELPTKKWDIIMMASAYHHIEDERKIEFLKRVKALLGKEGTGIIVENILPKYSNSLEYSNSVKRFYDAVLETAKAENPLLPEYVEGLIRKVAEYGCDGDYEYKVSMDIFKNHLKKVGLKIIEEKKVWPNTEERLNKDAGNFVFLIKST